uniref:Vitamin B12 import ATP-binding protein BtuD n=1 Tax=Candidatus Methanogaster sp. ANME-2c ERB4 TaxID=2759911 RepID=A0A7G9YPR4_9EURY|nr:vitamin B12 import ATP-binding protein BtuD [Methanosarcinales archaeon ANME-2c ERB4]
MNAVEIQGMAKSFNGSPVLDEINFKVRKGEVFGYLGPNGSGKTTTMRVMLGLLKPTSGKALIFGEEPDDLNSDLRSRIGVLMENNGLYERLSAYQNLLYHARLYGVPDQGRKGRIMELLEFAGLSDRWNEKTGRFSTGMKRKLGLARAMINDPEILFLDEPTAGLDPESRIIVRDLILRLSEEGGMTVFLNTHDLSEVEKVCSNAAILEGGKIRACDTIKGLRKAHDKPVLVITLVDTGCAERTLNLLTSQDPICNCERDDRIVTVALNGENPSTVLGMIVTNGIAVEEVKNATKSLEEVYLDIVRRKGGYE